nr:hypothetical protein TetV2_00250 [Oceanusvirus sp.]
MRSSARTWYSLALFAVAISAVAYVKPAFVYREDGTMYEFGLGPDKSVFSFGVVVSVAAIVSAFLFAIGDLMSPPAPDMVCKPMAILAPPPPPMPQPPMPQPMPQPPMPQPPMPPPQPQPRPPASSFIDTIVPPLRETSEQRRARIWG